MGVSSLSEEEPRTIGPWLREKAVRNGDKRALEVMDRTKSYADVDLDTDRVAMGLIELGLEPGDHVATMMKNSLECIDCWFGKSWTIKGLDGVRNDDYNLMHTQPVACLSSVADQVLFAPYWENLVHHFQNR